uniref:Protein kinase domain-containing protein n=1 Tax=Globisporangium ultimum (strain ATCC 200006 / CBS 805.95 / DAOM BR144) TaxID=431595 RepID=K3X7J9_GLOUD
MLLTSASHSSDTDAIQLWDDPELLAVRVMPEGIYDLKRLGIGGTFDEIWLVKFRGAQLYASKWL